MIISKQNISMKHIVWTCFTLLFVFSSVFSASAVESRTDQILQNLPKTSEVKDILSRPLPRPPGILSNVNDWFRSALSYLRENFPFHDPEKLWGSITAFMSALWDRIANSFVDAFSFFKKVFDIFQGTQSNGT